MGVSEKVENVHLANEKHDYGYSKRIAAYAFFTKHLKLNSDGTSDGFDVDESFIEVLSPERLMVFNDNNPRPPNALKNEIEIMQFLKFPINKSPYNFYKK